MRLPANFATIKRIFAIRNYRFYIAGMAWSDKDKTTFGKGATGYGVRLLDDQPVQARADLHVGEARLTERNAASIADGPKAESVRRDQLAQQALELDAREGVTGPIDQHATAPPLRAALDA